MAKKKMVLILILVFVLLLGGAYRSEEHTSELQSR